MSPCAFEKLFTTFVPHVLEKIFFSLDYESFKACQEVCKDWYEVLSMESFKLKANTMLTVNGEKLRSAIDEKNLDEVFRVLSFCMVDVNCDMESYPETLFSYALFTGHTEMVKLLLNARADTNEANRYGETPLHFAVRCYKKKLVQQLLDSRADPNKADGSGQTPLNWAAYKGKTAVVKLLIERGAEVDKADNKGRTPLHIAANYRHKNVVKALLDGGADPTKKDRWGITPLSEARHSCRSWFLTNDKMMRRAVAKMSLSQKCCQSTSRWRGRSY